MIPPFDHARAEKLAAALSDAIDPDTAVPGNLAQLYELIAALAITASFPMAAVLATCGEEALREAMHFANDITLTGMKEALRLVAAETSGDQPAPPMPSKFYRDA
jgi:hypothetical protein